MIPLKDDIPSRTTPYVSWMLIALCAVAFLAQLGQAPGAPSLVESLGMIPARVMEPDRVIVVRDVVQQITPVGPRLRAVERPAAPPLVPAWLTVLTCVFLHGGWLHFLGNMWFLFIFGDNVEDRMGHGGFLAFYLGSGVAASLAQLLAAPDATIPTIGASGAIAGVMGAYFYLYPRAKVLALVPIFVLLHILVVPAVVFLGVWFALQLLHGTMASAAAGGVAWWAHIGGFVAGLLVAMVLGRDDPTRPPVEPVRLRAGGVPHYRLRLPRR